MLNSNWLSEKQFRLISIVLFIFLFVYIILRSIFVDILHDEAATFLHYIETGYFWGPKSITDANNHLLNSVICHGIYTLFGENFFLFRLPNVLSFPLYFWAIYKLVSVHKNHVFRLFVLAGTTCIPFIIEYFANCRGYGISLAFFTASLVFLYRLAQALSLKLHVLVSVCLLVAAYSNLTFLVSALLASVFILILQINQKKTLSIRRQVRHFLIHLCFALLIIPAGIYARVLKEGGALYYGSLDGLWEVTGHTLTYYTLHTNHIVLKWVLLLGGLLLIAILIREWKKLGTTDFFSKRDTLLAWFLFGHLFVILVLAHFMEVNYPEDRVGMYLIVLTLLLVGGMIQRLQKTHFLFLGFLFFPISMIPKMNLVTSIFSPDDRMTQTFYNNVYHHTKGDKTTIAMYHLMKLIWPLHNRNSEKLFFPFTSNVPNQSSDVVLSRLNLNIPAENLTQFDTLFLDHSNGFIAYQRKVPFQKTLLFDTTVNTNKSRDKFIGIRTFKIPDSLKKVPLQIHVNGQIIIDDPRNEVSIAYSIFNKEMEPNYLDNWVTRWYNGLKKRQQFNVNIPIEEWTEDDDEIRIYLFNPQNTEVGLSNVKFEILKLD